MPLQFASLYDGQEVFVWSDCLLGLGTDFLVGNMVFVSDAYYASPHSTLKTVPTQASEGRDLTATEAVS